MELGLLSNMLVNSELYWQAYVPPLFSAIAGDRTNVRIVEPPPVAWSRCAEWKLVRSRVKACDTLFWLQLSARPAPQIHLASLSRLGARRANFVIDAWKPVLTKIGVAATIERLDPCFIAYLEATTELKRRFRWRSSSGCRMPATRIFFTRARTESRTWPSIWAAATRLCIRRS